MRSRRKSKALLVAALTVLGLAPPLLLPARADEPSDTVLVSADPSGAEGNHFSSPGVISGNGRYVAYSSMASNLVDGDVNGKTDVFVYDRTTGRNELISLASDGTQGNNDSFLPTISHDGRYVAFASIASNLAPGDTGIHAEPLRPRSRDRSDRADYARRARAIRGRVLVTTDQRGRKSDRLLP